MWNDNNITPKVLLVHIQSVQTEMRTMRDDLTKRIDAVDKKLDIRFNLLSQQIENIDQRLDAIEIESIPKRVRKLEKRVFAK